MLQGLANGIADEREAVREGCAQTLCEALRDNHLRSVPTSLVIEILASMVVPAIHVLWDFIYAESNKSTLRGGAVTTLQSAASKGAQTAGSNGKPTNKDETVLVVGKDLSKDGNFLVLGQCLDTLGLSFLDNFDRLSKYPSFDKLWLRTVQCFLHFVDGPAEFEASISSEHQMKPVLERLSEVALNNLQTLLVAAKDRKVFEQRPGLKSVTVEFLRHAKQASLLLASLSIEEES